MLRRASEGHIIYSSSQKAFINITTDAQVQFNAEEYADLSGEIYHSVRRII